MKPLLTPGEMAARDKATIAAGTPAHVLMERAGRAVASAAIRLAGGRYGKHAAVVCAKGNNGSDGFVAARLLMQEGLRVTCMFVGDVDLVRGDGGLQRGRFLKTGGHITPLDGSMLSRADVVVDALFGTGFSGPAEGEAGEAIEAINRSGTPVVSVDIPSGVDGVTGSVDGPAVRADVTVAMAAEKIGTAIGMGASLAGEVQIADIGIDVGGSNVWLIEEWDVASALPKRPLDAHKRSVGSVALLCGSLGMSGAAMLSGRGAVRMGAGYVTLGIPASIEPMVSVALPEVLTERLTTEKTLGPEVLDGFKDVLGRADAIAIGPGIGQGERQRELVGALLRSSRQPCVLDADALNVLAEDVSVLVERRDPCVITPHPAELGRLLKRPTDAVQSDRPAAAREAAREFSCTVMLKGYRSVIATPQGNCYVTPAGSSHLATAGTGDVLTGAVAALLAAGLGEVEAAWVGAYVHGVAGDIAAARRGGRGVVAWDVAESLGAAAARLRNEHG